MKKSSLFLLLIALSACNGIRTIKAVFRDVSPYERYVESLRKAGLLNASMANEWVSAGDKAFNDSVFIDVPFSESGFFQASSPQARSYRFHAQDGQVLTVEGAAKSHRDAKLFLDLFVRDEAGWDRIEFGDSTLSLTHEFTTDEECILRLQPELIVNAWYSISISLTPVLINPVYGASNKAIGSFYGASRDDGKRAHEGVDIFAPKGTPVVAPTEGYISRVATGGLGGKVVWMKDLKRGHSYYFAHLDSQMVQPGMHVRQGHVLGLVGNTGNARHTPSHLHFGIYQAGSKNPLYYIRQMGAAIASLPIDTGFQQKSFKIGRPRTSLMVGPSKTLGVKSSLEKDTYVTVVGQTADWYRIALPDETQGFVLKKHVVALSAGTSGKIDSTTLLLSDIRNQIPIAVLKENTHVDVLARFEGYTFVVTEKGKAGWLSN
jgi:peptidoglycan LD-endopeptidase LytH